MDIVEFLRARLDEDEAAAKEAAAQWGDDGPDGSYTWERYKLSGKLEDTGWWPPPVGFDSHWQRTSPARVLREVEAKRRIVDLHKTSWHEWTSADGMDVNGGPVCDGCSEDPPCPTICTLALPYADHPDYRQEWA